MLTLMALVLYNTFSKREEPFVPLVPGTARLYTCGPTVYGRPHIGNYSSFLMADLLRRWLEAGHGLKVTHVKNITDVGHLVADRDTGEDKIEKQAREEFGRVSMESVLGIARKYEAEYVQDERTLNLVEPEHRPRATEYIPQMREMTEALLASGHAYATDDGVYFDVQRFPAYGSLSGNTVENLAAGARVAVDERKRHPADFALWKFCVGPNAQHVLRWPSPKGPAGETHPDGFPGWHIECSAMSRALLGDTFDIHTGGEDNIFPHHECEIAQSESVTGKPFVRAWVHKRRIDLAGEKMSKSLGNVLTLAHVLEKGYSAQDLRYYLLSVHYRTNLKFTWKGIDDAHKARRKILEWMQMGWSAGPHVGSHLKHAQVEDLMLMSNHFREAMDADLNTSAALAAVFECVNYSYSHAVSGPALRAVEEFIQLVRDTLGCFDVEQEQAIPEDVNALLTQRVRARSEKNFAESDRLRDELAKRGYEVKDVAGGQQVKKM